MQPKRLERMKTGDWSVKVGLKGRFSSVFPDVPNRRVDSKTGRTFHRFGSRYCLGCLRQNLRGKVGTAHSEADAVGRHN